jgi:hypothetical protein
VVETAPTSYSIAHLHDTWALSTQFTPVIKLKPTTTYKVGQTPRLIVCGTRLCRGLVLQQAVVWQ